MELTESKSGPRTVRLSAQAAKLLKERRGHRNSGYGPVLKVPRARSRKRPKPRVRSVYSFRIECLSKLCSRSKSKRGTINIGSDQYSITSHLARFRDYCA